VTTVEVLFGLLGLAAVGSALLVVTTSRLVHAALWLVVTLGALAGCYLLLAAEFVAWVQVLIYVGAVVVLLLFALMLTRAPTGAEAGTTTPNQPLAAIVSVLVAAALCATVVAGFRDVRLDLDETVVGSATSTGEAIFTSWVLPFEVLSVLLVAALVGAIVLSRSAERPGPGPGPGSVRGDPAPDLADRGHPAPETDRTAAAHNRAGDHDEEAG
jgi:NADH-quinone oxidoreductase subunit J